jgi:signal transduction histidine kinase/HAMP domain-containing protein
MSVRQRFGDLLQRWLNIGLRAKMSLLVEVGLIGLMTIFLFLAVSTAQQNTRQILNERMTLARFSAAALDSTLNQVESVMALVSGRTALRDPTATPFERQAALDAAYNQLMSISQGVYLLKPDGTHFTASPVDAGMAPWQGAPFFQEAGRSVQPGAKPQLLQLEGSPPSVVVVLPVFDYADQLSGWLTTALDFTRVSAASIGLGKTGTLDLVDANGRVLISSQPERSGETGAPPEVLNRLFVAGKPVVETCLGCNPDETVESGDEVIAFAPLSLAPWGVIVRQKASEVMAPVNRLLIQSLLLGLATIVGALLMVWVTTGSVIRPVQMLQEAAERIAGGDLSTPVEDPTPEWLSIRGRGSGPRRDEIGALAASFETMRKQLKSSLEETRSLNRQLDARVQERTRDALQAHESLIQRNQQLSILNTLASTVNQSLDLEEILQRSLDAVLTLTEVDVGAVFLLEGLHGGLTLMASRGLSEEAARMAGEMGMLDGSCGGVLEYGTLVVVPDLSRYRGKRARSLQRENLRTLVHVPLTSKGSVLGSMCVGTRCQRDFNVEEQELLTAIGSQIAVAIENARLYAEVQHKERMRGELFQKAINAQEEERKRIARELHDETSQALAALIYAVEEGLEMKSLAQVRRRLGTMRDLLQHTLDGVHKLIFDLRPSMLDHLGLAPAIRWLAKSRLEAKGVKVAIHETGEERRLPSEMETALFRVAQEAISNIARHSAARNASITFTLCEDMARVSIKDDGIGFDVNGLGLAPDSPRGLGLLSMQERLELLGGDLQIQSAPGGGTLLDISIPLTSDTPVLESTLPRTDNPNGSDGASSLPGNGGAPHA